MANIFRNVNFRGLTRCGCCSSNDVDGENDNLEPIMQRLATLNDDEEIIIRQVAFDSAVGPGGKSIGGKGGPQYFVTSRDDETTGCFRECLMHKNRREISFATTGLVYLTRPIYNVRNNNLTIDGRIPSSRAACVVGGTILFDNSADIILRYTTFRGVNLVISQCTNVIIDHCDFSFGSLVITKSEAVTIQWNKFDDEKVTLDNPYNILSFCNIFSNCITNVSRTNFVNCSFSNTLSPYYFPITVLSTPVRLMFSVLIGYETIDANVAAYENIVITNTRKSVEISRQADIAAVLKDNLDPNCLDCDLVTFVQDPVTAHNAIIDYAGSNPKKNLPARSESQNGISKVLPNRKSKSILPAEFIEMIKVRK